MTGVLVGVGVRVGRGHTGRRYAIGRRRWRYDMEDHRKVIRGRWAWREKDRRRADDERNTHQCQSHAQRSGHRTSHDWVGGDTVERASVYSLMIAMLHKSRLYYQTTIEARLTVFARPTS
jgi:hypothetical protein